MYCWCWGSWGNWGTSNKGWIYWVPSWGASILVWKGYGLGLSLLVLLWLLWDWLKWEELLLFYACIYSNLVFFALVLGHRADYLYRWRRFKWNFSAWSVDLKTAFRFYISWWAMCRCSLCLISWHSSHTLLKTLLRIVCLSGLIPLNFGSCK